MKHHLAKKMYKIHGFCFDPCTVEYEADLRKAGLYEQYEKRMMNGNIAGFIQDVENWVVESINQNETFVTEQGDIEDWGTMSKEYKAKVLSNLQDYLNVFRKHIS